jgi:D-3-phosphoglycerate dehydrogenase
MWRVLVTCRHLQETIDDYRPLFAEHQIHVEMPPVLQQLSEEELLAIIDNFDGMIAGDDHLTARVLKKAADNLKIIVKWGVGVDAIDLEAARALGILVRNTPGVFPDEVADVTIGYLIMLARQLHKIDQGVRSGEWPKIRGRSLAEKRLGVIGVGSIGQAVVRRGLTMGLQVCAHDIKPVPEGLLREPRFESRDLDSLLEESDFITLCCNLTPENWHMLSVAQFSRMRDGVYVINTARGPLIDEDALIKALRSGKIAGAALDVFEAEPLPVESQLREFDSCIFGTHNSSNTWEAVKRVNERAIELLFEGLQGAARGS